MSGSYGNGLVDAGVVSVFLDQGVADSWWDIRVPSRVERLPLASF